MDLDLTMLNENWLANKFKRFQNELPRASKGFDLDDFRTLVTLMLCHSSALIEVEYGMSDKTIKKIRDIVIGGERIVVARTA